MKVDAANLICLLLMQKFYKIWISGDNDSSSETKELNLKTDENVGNYKKDINKTDEIGKDDHKLLIAIAYNVKKLDSENENIVKALRQNNRYLHSILRHMKELLKKEQSSSHVGDVWFLNIWLINPNSKYLCDINYLYNSY